MSKPSSALLQSFDSAPDSQPDSSPVSPGDLSSIIRTGSTEETFIAAASSTLAGAHVRFLRLYEDFHLLANAEYDRSAVLEIVSSAKLEYSLENQDVAVLLAALRRKAVGLLLLKQQKRALAAAEQIIRLQFNWPYGHLAKADALLLGGQLVEASAAYQLAEQLMPHADPTDDIGRPEVLEMLQELSDHMAAVSCMLLTQAHSDEITALAAWPCFNLKQRRRVRKVRNKACSVHSAHELKASVHHMVNSALDVITREGGMDSGMQLSVSSRTPSPEGVWSGSALARATQQCAAKPDCPSEPASSETIDRMLNAEILRARKQSAGAAVAQPPENDGGLSSINALFDSNRSGQYRTSASHMDGPASSTSLDPGFYPRDHEHDSVDSGGVLGAIGHAAPAAGTPPHDAAGARLDSATDMQTSRTSTASMAPGWWREEQRRQSTVSVAPSERSQSSARWSTMMLSDMHRFVATGCLDGSVRVWDAARLERVNDLVGHTASITCVVWSEQACKGCALVLATADEGGGVMIWALDADGSVLEQRSLVHHTGRIVGMRFVTSRKLVTASVDSALCIWRVDTGTLEASLYSHNSAITSMASLSIRSAIALATCAANGSWRVWDLALKRAVLAGREKGGCTAINFTPRIHNLSPPRPLLATCHWRQSKHTSSVHLWDVFAPRHTSEAGGSAPAVAPIKSFTHIAKDQIKACVFTVGHTSRPLMAVAALDGSLTVVDLCSRAIFTQLYDVHTGADGKTQPIYSIQYSPDGRMLFSCGADCSVKVWSTADMEVLLTLQGHSSAVVAMCPAGDAGVLATGCESGELAFWDLRLAQKLASGAELNFATT